MRWRRCHWAFIPYEQQKPFQCWLQTSGLEAGTHSGFTKIRDGSRVQSSNFEVIVYSTGPASLLFPPSLLRRGVWRRLLFWRPPVCCCRGNREDRGLEAGRSQEDWYNFTALWPLTCSHWNESIQIWTGRFKFTSPYFKWLSEYNFLNCLQSKSTLRFCSIKTMQSLFLICSNASSQLCLRAPSQFCAPFWGDSSPV